MTLPEFSRVFGALALQLRLTDADPTTCAAYFDVLSKQPLEATRMAANGFASESGRRWFPTSGEWLGKAQEAATADVRKRLTSGRDEPWHNTCSNCESDSGWVYFECPGDTTCGRVKVHAPHSFVRECHCRATNLTYQRKQRFGA